VVNDTTSTESKFTYFWGQQDVFSQWHPSNFVDNYGYHYNCCEQFMMACKAILFYDSEAYMKIMQETRPSEHKKLGRTVRGFIESEWNMVSKQVVYSGNYFKFTQNPALLKALLETKGELVEASPYDKIWGIGLRKEDPRAWSKDTWLGTNWLGEILTRLRGDLHALQSIPQNDDRTGSN
jgi:ribA/ribD-fused uncharacterized protein